MVAQLTGSFHLDPVYSEIVQKKVSTYCQISNFMHYSLTCIRKKTVQSSPLFTFSLVTLYLITLSTKRHRWCYQITCIYLLVLPCTYPSGRTLLNKYPQHPVCIPASRFVQSQVCPVIPPPNLESWTISQEKKKKKSSLSVAALDAATHF